MRYFSSFSGIGGFELGINKAYEQLFLRYGRDTENSDSFGCELSQRNGSKENAENRQNFKGENTCIGYSEINKYADQIYQSKFPEHQNYGDITKIIASELPDFDLFVGGFPCQAFSIAGKRGGFDDTRGTLFFDCARILKEKQPRNFILENVKGLDRKSVV
jgi:DNA (cytosine-5)-methyltransferase 1